MPIWIILLLAIFIILLTISIVLYFIQDSFIFHAVKLPPDYKYAFKNEFEEINLKTDDGNILNAVLFKAADSKGMVLFFHNHSGNVEHWSSSANFIINYNYDVLMIDYRGYGKSTGKYNEELMLKDSLLWYNFARKIYDEESITIYGRGIGATFATYVSSLNNPKRLILESPLYDLLSTAKFLYAYVPFKKVISRYNFNTAEYITKVKCRIYIFHGMKDRLVSYKSSEKLHERVRENSELYLMPDGNHYNLITNSIYLNKVKDILKA